LIITGTAVAVSQKIAKDVLECGRRMMTGFRIAFAELQKMAVPLGLTECILKPEDGQNMTEACSIHY